VHFCSRIGHDTLRHHKDVAKSRLKYPWAVMGPQLYCLPWPRRPGPVPSLFPDIGALTIVWGVPGAHGARFGGDRARGAQPGMMELSELITFEARVYR